MQIQMFDFANKMNSEIGVEWMHRPISPDLKLGKTIVTILL